MRDVFAALPDRLTPDDLGSAAAAPVKLGRGPPAALSVLTRAPKAEGCCGRYAALKASRSLLNTRYRSSCGSVTGTERTAQHAAVMTHGSHSHRQAQEMQCTDSTQGPA